MAAERDQTDLGFSAYADAALAWACGTFVVAAQRLSSMRSFAGVDFA
ncbi:hypothetical protein [uncultured Shimia sp.]|nr:hypothetical protein [uncultured Shimia sp.]